MMRCFQSKPVETLAPKLRVLNEPYEPVISALGRVDGVADSNVIVPPKAPSPLVLWA